MRGLQVTPFLASARDWNDRVYRSVLAALARPGARIKLTPLPYGTIVSADDQSGWRHPWFTESAWDGRKKRWTITVKPGFVNGHPPLVEVADEKKKRVKVPLTDEPRIPLFAFRKLPGVKDRVPAFFVALGVSEEASGGINLDESGGITIDADAQEAAQSSRRLLACDVYLTQARAAVRGQIALIDGSGTSGQVADYAVSYDTVTLDEMGEIPQLAVASKAPKNAEPTLTERLLGDYQDPGADYARICTIYFLSPEGDASDAVRPGQAWTPFVAHAEFFNLSYVQRNRLPIRRQDSIRLATGLAAGFGDLIGNQLLVETNEFTQRVLGAVAATDQAGKFHSI